MIEAALRQLLVDRVDGVGPRVMPSAEVGELAKGLPKIAFTLIGSPRTLTNDGPTRVVTARFQLDIYAALPRAARAIADNARTELDGFRGTVEGVSILLMRFDDDSSGGTAAAGGQNTAAAKHQQDIFLTYRE